MFDFNYNENVGFVPYVSVVREKAGKSSEEIAETKKAVKNLSETVATQSESVAENSAAIASNTSAIADETAAREAAVEELNEKISEVPKFKIEVVDSLPAEGDSATIYLLKISEEAGNLYEEYVYSNGAWEKLGPMVDLSGYATKDEMEAAFAGVYTKDEVDALIAPLAIQADVDAALALKADADAVYTKDEVDAAIAPLAVKDEVDAALDEKANSSDVYTKDEADAKFLTEHQDISGLATKDELSDAVEPLAVKADVEDALALKADADSVYTKDEADAKFLTEHQDISGLASKTELEEAVAPLAVKADVDTALDEKADADAVYTKDEADAKFLTEHQDISTLATKTELEEAVAPLAVKSAVDVAINQEADERAQGDAAAVAAIGAVTTALDAEVTAREEAVSAETVARMAAIAELHEEIVALPKFKILIVDELPAVGDTATFYLLATGDEQENVYTEYVYVNGAWEEIGTQSLDLSEYAKTADVDAAIASVNDDINTLSGIVETLTYEFDSVDEKLAGLAEANAEQDEAINEINSGLTELAEVKANASDVDEALTAKVDVVDYDKLVSDFKKLKGIVGDLGGNVEYAVPEEGKLIDVLKKSGTVKLMEDVESATYTGGITSKNVTTLNTNGKTITFTGSTTNNPGIMTRGAEQLTIVGKGTINANGRIAIEANGANSVINLSGSTGFFGAEPTYVTDRSGGELIYCYLGTINIYAGVFKNEGENKTFMLNCYDANYRNGTAKIVVMGGKFYDFDPANNTAEGEGTSFVPEGYESVHTTEEIDGVTHDVYTVKKSA